jgi:flagellum-specific peptidoglycan hydrolase FlgJ
LYTPTNAEKLAFIEEIAPYAVMEMARTVLISYPVLSSYKIAQACLESNYGFSTINGNYFGVKGSGTAYETNEFINGQWVVVTASFETYGSMEASVIGHSQFLIENGRYARAGLFKAGFQRDWKTACYVLENATYATDPEYAELLIGLINKYDLSQYDREADQMLKVIEQLQQTNATIMNTLDAHVEEINKLKAQASMPVPKWANEATQAALKADIIDTVDGGSYDFYRTLTVLHRKGLI